MCSSQCNQGKPIRVYHMLSVPLTSSLSAYISGSFQAFCLFPFPVPCILTHVKAGKAESSTPARRQIDDRSV